MTTTQKMVSADDIVRLHLEREKCKERMDILTEMINDSARSLHEAGGEMTTSDGNMEVVYRTTPRRTVRPELVADQFPTIYERVKAEQIASYRPKFTLTELGRYIGQEDIDKVVTTAPTETVSIRAVKQ